MKISLTDLQTRVSTFLNKVGFSDHDVSTFSKLIIDQEMIGNRFSAVGEIEREVHELMEGAKLGPEEIVVTKPALSLIKGNGRPAFLITADHLDTVVAKAKTQGMYALGIYDSTYNNYFDVFCRRIAAQDCLVIIAENGGPQGVVPFGGRQDVTGTNPLAYGIPTHESPIIFDAATAAHAYGYIRLAKETGESLPDNSYVDKEGDVTTDPHQATAVMPFGGFKGYAINLLMDVLSGALVRGKSGLDMPTDSQRYIGTLMIVIDPAAFGEINDFKDSTTKLLNDLLAVAPVDSTKPVRVPGVRGTERIRTILNEGMIEIDDKEWAKFERAEAAVAK